MLRIVRVLAPNPSPYTLEGTNTWVVGEDPVVVIDPGPDDPAHLDEVATVAGDRVAAVLVTHDHPDHAPGASAFASRVGAPLLAFRLTGAEHLRDGQQVSAGSVTLTAVHTPGHTSDHVAFHVPAAGALFTGDAVLGRGTSFIDPPDGDLAAYLRSLARMRELAPDHDLPGTRARRAAGRREAAGVRRSPGRARASDRGRDLRRAPHGAPRWWPTSTRRTRPRCTTSRLGRCWRTC